MIRNIVAQEQERLSRLGYDSIVTPETITVTRSIVNINLGNATYVLSDIGLSDIDRVTDKSTVTIISSTDAIGGTQRQISQMGRAIAHSFGGYLIVKTRLGSDAWKNNALPAPFQLHFFKVTPIKRR